jgi:hypothetical protein
MDSNVTHGTRTKICWTEQDVGGSYE